MFFFTLLKKTKLERVESMFSSNTEGVGSTTSYTILKCEYLKYGTAFKLKVWDNPDFKHHLDVLDSVRLMDLAE